VEVFSEEHRIDVIDTMSCELLALLGPHFKGDSLKDRKKNLLSIFRVVYKESCQEVFIDHEGEIQESLSSQPSLMPLHKEARKKHSKKVTIEKEEAIIQFAMNYPKYGEDRVSEELKKKKIFVSATSVRRVWVRKKLNTMDMRLKALENMESKYQLTMA